jgi:hypothetical protein
MGRFIRFVFCLPFILDSSFAACGLMDGNGKILEKISNQDLNAFLGKSWTSDIFDIYDCNEERCAFALYDGFRQNEYGCETENEFIESVKKIFGRTITKGKYRRPFSYGRMSKVMSADDFYVGCDFLTIIPKIGEDTLTAVFEPLKEGDCPVYMRVGGERNGVYMMHIGKRNGRWSFGADYYRPPETYPIDERSEFTFYERELPLYIEPCKGDKCVFYSTERLPFPKGGMDAVLLKNLKRIVPECDFIRPVPTENRRSSGEFIVSNVGRCKIRIEHRFRGAEIIPVKVVKTDKNYWILLEAP